MKVQLSERSIELIAENEHESDALARLLRHSRVKVVPGESTDRSWPPDPRKTNVLLVMPDPNEW